MDAIKKTGIAAGAIIGGAIGGTISFAGKMTKVKWVDELGESITQSSIFTGETAGSAISGTAELVAGKLSGNEEIADQGWGDLKDCGQQVVGNFVDNTKYILKNGASLAGGLWHRDGGKTAGSVKNLAKIIALGAITVGTVKVVDQDGGSSTADQLSTTEKNMPSDE